MTKKELSQLYHLNLEIEDDIKRLLELENAATKTTVSYGGVACSGKVTNKTALAAEIADLKSIISAKQIQSVAEYNRLVRYISGIEDSFIRRIFTYRFIDGLSWGAVAKRVSGNNTADSVRKCCDRFLRKK